MTGWSGSCEVTQVSNDISVLEQSIHHHQSLYEAMCQAYTEVCYHLSYHLHILWLQLVTCSTCQTRANLVILNFTCLSFLQVHSTSKKLLYQLDHLVQLTNAAPNESPQKKHVSSQKHAVCKFLWKLSVGTDIYFTMYFFVI